MLPSPIKIYLAMVLGQSENRFDVLHISRLDQIHEGRGSVEIRQIDQGSQRNHLLNHIRIHHRGCHGHVENGLTTSGRLKVG